MWSNTINPQLQPQRSSHPQAGQQAALPTQLAILGGGQGIPSLEIESNLQGKLGTYDLTAPVINIGRDPSNDIVINEPIVSAFHMQIVHKGNQFILVHPHPKTGHTTNGLLYQNRHILGNETFQKPLICGDIFRIGNERGELITLTYNDGSGTQQGNKNTQVTAARTTARGTVGAARITAISGIIIAIITAIVGPLILKGILPSPPGPTETLIPPTSLSQPNSSSTTRFPLLHSSYQGTITNQVRNITFSISMFNVAENPSTGTFTASITDSGCTGQVNNGTVTTDGDVTFTYTIEESNVACAVRTVEFKGHIDSAGGITGNWDAPNGGGNGSFNLS